MEDGRILEAPNAGSRGGDHTVQLR
jgi:hypothetical protein